MGLLLESLRIEKLLNYSTTKLSKRLDSFVLESPTMGNGISSVEAKSVHFPKDQCELFSNGNLQMTLRLPDGKNNVSKYVLDCALRYHRSNFVSKYEIMNVTEKLPRNMTESKIEFPKGTTVTMKWWTKGSNFNTEIFFHIPDGNRLFTRYFYFHPDKVAKHTPIGEAHFAIYSSKPNEVRKPYENHPNRFEKYKKQNRKWVYAE